MSKTTLFRLWLGLIGLTAVIVTVLYFRHPGRPLTRDNMEEARSLWASKSISSYTMRIVIDGAQDNVMDVDVVNGSVVALKANGVAPPESSWSYWTIEGMFDFLKNELDQAEMRQENFGSLDQTPIVLKVHYHEKLGYPQVFFRYIKNHPSNIRWKITKFKKG